MFHCRVGRHDMTLTVASTVSSFGALCLLGVGMHHLCVRGMLGERYAKTAGEVEANARPPIAGMLVAWGDA